MIKEIFDRLVEAPWAPAALRDLIHIVDKDKLVAICRVPDSYGLPANNSLLYLPNSPANTLSGTPEAKSIIFTLIARCQCTGDSPVLEPA
jgi:hypothetical protein